MARADDKRKPGKGRSEPRATRAVSAPQAGGYSAMFEHHQATAVDSLLRLLLDPVASLLTWAVIGIALALPLCLLLLLQNLQQVGASLDQGGGISLFMELGLPQEQLEQRGADLRARADIANVAFMTPEEALAEFETASGFGDLLQGLDANPLPAVFLVTPTQGTDVAALQAALAALPGVELAQLDLAWVQRLNALVALAMRFALLLALMLGVGVILVIGNTVRLAIENRRAEIVVVKLVGGTDAYVSRPFLYTGLWYGVGGGVLAIALVAMTLFALQGPVSDLMQTWNGEFRLRGLGLSSSFFVLAGAGLLGWLGAWVSVLRHLRAIEPR